MAAIETRRLGKGSLEWQERFVQKMIAIVGGLLSGISLHGNTSDFMEIVVVLSLAYRLCSIETLSSWPSH